MMSLEQIRALSAERAREAAEEGMEPFIVWEDDLKAIPPFPFPFLGDYVPEGWKMVTEYFVDSSGFGEEGEGALTAEQFASKIVVGRGYAVTEAGQFQVYVGEYEKV